MTEQEQKAVEEYAKKASQIDTLIISNCRNESIKAYNEGVHNGILMGAQLLDNLRIASEPDKELLEALKETDKDLCVLESTMLQIEQRDHLAEGMAELVKKWRARNKQAISNYEQTDQMTYSDYVRKDLALEFAIRFYQLMTSARVDEYIGARKDVCVNDLFKEFLKTKEDEKP